MEIIMPMTADYYLDIANQALARGGERTEPEEALADFAGAQVSATQAVAAALVRLAEAVESLRTPPPTVRFPAG
jgi:hypothetical protein